MPPSVASKVEESGRSVLYLSYDGMSDPLGQSQVLPYLAGLTRRGHRITLVSFEKNSRGADEMEAGIPRMREGVKTMREQASKS